MYMMKMSTDGNGSFYDEEVSDGKVRIYPSGVTRSRLMITGRSCTIKRNGAQASSAASKQNPTLHAHQLTLRSFQNSRHTIVWTSWEAR